jgi:hypothetical protein
VAITKSVDCMLGILLARVSFFSTYLSPYLSH